MSVVFSFLLHGYYTESVRSCCALLHAQSTRAHSTRASPSELQPEAKVQAS
jgi:hypothetical protein